MAQASGMAPELDRFDAQFFAVHSRLGFFIDPMSRKMLEQAYQAIYDAGKLHVVEVQPQDAMWSNDYQ